MNKTFDSTTLHPLRDRLEGEVLLPDDPGYDEARAVWNGRFDPHPLAMARCRSTADVVAAVEFARDNGLPLSVRGGGHSYAGHAVADDALALDLSAMATVEVDAERRRATVGAGAKWADLDGAAQASGLATTGGTVSSVGVAGYTLGGGTGYLARKYGLGLDNLVAAEVVLADGRVVEASEDENEDLFWGLRGGSGNFGIVTSFDFRLHPLGPEVVSAQAFHPFDDARDALHFYREFMAEAPDEVTAYAFVLRVPPVEPFPEHHHGKVAIAFVACHCGALEEGEAALRPLKEFGDPILTMLQRVPYTTVQQGFDAGSPPGLRWYSRAHYLEELPDDAIDTMLQHAESLPGAFSMAYLEPMGGAIGRVDPSATAFPHRNARYGIHIFPGWTDPARDEEMKLWAREFHDAMAPYATGGVYVNLLGGDEENGVAAAYGGNYERLTRLKAKWDPENVFRSNHNIRPRQT